VGPEQLPHPPALDPGVCAVESRRWGSEVYHLVRHGGSFLAWIQWPGHDDQVYSVATEDAGRRCLDSQQARSLLNRGQGVSIARVEVVDPDGHHLIGSAAVLVDEDAGVALATFDAAGDGTYALSRFDRAHSALEAFAVWVEEEAAAIEGGQTVGYAEIIAAHLRYRGAMARADAARSELGDAIRRNDSSLRAKRAIRSVAHAVGVSREFFYRVLAEREWILSQR
jgi:hypothetical protein